MSEPTKRTYTMTDEEFAELKRLSIAANTAPVMMVGTVDVSQAARDDVMYFWQELGWRYGFQWDTAEARLVPQEFAALPLAEPAAPAGGGADHA